MKKERERVIVDVYHDECGFDLFMVMDARIWHLEKRAVMADACSSSGFFVHEDDLNEWLDEHKADIVVVEDLRSGC